MPYALTSCRSEPWPLWASQLPPARGDRQIALLVEATFDRTEVEATTVCCKAKLDRRDTEVGPGDDPAIDVDDRERRHNSRERRVVEASGEQLLEPGVGHAPLTGHSVEQPQHRAGAGGIRAMHTLDRLPDRFHRDALAASRDERPVDLAPIDHRSETAQRAGDGRAREAVHGRAIDVVERGDVVGDGVRELEPEPARDAGLDHRHTGMVEAVQPMEPSRGAM